MIPTDELQGLLSGLANLDDSGLSMLSSLAKSKKKAAVAQEKIRICVLEVERQDDYLPSLTVCLNNYHPYFEVSTAGNYSDALDIFDSEKDVKLAIIDLRLHRIDGFKLLAKLFCDFPKIPAIVMLNKIDSAWRTRFSSLFDVGLLSHPLDQNDLKDAIGERLQDKKPPLVKKNILGTLLALMEKEQKTTLMALSSGSQSGSCFVRDGQIVDAICGDKSGEKALNELLGWNCPEVLFTDFSDPKIKRKINKTIYELTAGQSEGQTDLKIKELASLSTGEEFSGKETVKPIESQSVSSVQRDAGEESLLRVTLHDVGVVVDPKNLKEELVMALESYLERFKKINGYKASAIMNFTGEILAQDSNDPNIDLGLVGATFNDIFRTAHEASDKIGLEACREAAISTPKGIIIMRCSGIKSKVHYHTIAIFSADGNQALAKMEMEKMIPAVMEELA
jgi:CheY-like chemotaxis protein/predicted regulator of Ras-like GTPase activity (Roadblock/LC7/MglB family)